MAKFNRVALRDAVRMAAKVLPSRPDNVLYRCVKLDNNQVIAVGHAETAIIPVQGDGDISCVVNAAELLSRLDVAGDEEEVNLTATDDALTIKTKKSKWKLAVPMQSSQMAVVQPQPSERYTCDAKAFRLAIEATLCAASTDTARPNIYCIQMHTDGQVIASDGHRAHLFSGGPHVTSRTVMTPSFAKAILSAKGDEWRTSDNEKHFIVETESGTFIHSQSNTEPAPIKSMVANEVAKVKDKGCKVVVDSTALKAALKAASVAAEFGQVLINPVADGIEIVGRGTEDVTTIASDDKVNAFAINAQYLQQAIDAIGEPQVEIWTHKKELLPIFVGSEKGNLENDCIMLMQSRR